MLINFVTWNMQGATKDNDFNPKRTQIESFYNDDAVNIIALQEAGKSSSVFLDDVNISQEGLVNIGDWNDDYGSGHDYKVGYCLDAFAKADDGNRCTIALLIENSGNIQNINFGTSDLYGGTRMGLYADVTFSNGIEIRFVCMHCIANGFDSKQEAKLILKELYCKNMVVGGDFNTDYEQMIDGSASYCGDVLTIDKSRQLLTYSMKGQSHASGHNLDYFMLTNSLKGYFAGIDEEDYFASDHLARWLTLDIP